MLLYGKKFMIEIFDFKSIVGDSHLVKVFRFPDIFLKQRVDYKRQKMICSDILLCARSFKSYL